MSPVLSQILPRQIIKAAGINSASELRIFLRIILPLSTPALATVAIFAFIDDRYVFLQPYDCNDSIKMETILTAELLPFCQQEAGYPARYNWIMAADLIG